MKTTFLALACLATASAAAQTVTTPPRAMSSQQETPGVDSTFQGDVVPNTQSSSITINTGGGAPAPAPGPAPAPTPAPAPPPPLVINGQTFSNFVSVPEDNAGGHPSGQAALAFSAWNGGWQIYEMGYQEATTVLATGVLPSGAVSVSYSVSGITQDGDKPVASLNQAASPTALQAPDDQALVDLATAVVRGTSSDISEGSMSVTVYFYDSAGTVISKTSFTFKVGASGSA